VLTHVPWSYGDTWASPCFWRFVPTVGFAFPPPFFLFHHSLLSANPPRLGGLPASVIPSLVINFCPYTYYAVVVRSIPARHRIYSRSPKLVRRDLMLHSKPAATVPIHCLAHKLSRSVGQRGAVPCNSPSCSPRKVNSTRSICSGPNLRLRRPPPPPPEGAFDPIYCWYPPRPFRGDFCCAQPGSPIVDAPSNHTPALTGRKYAVHLLLVGQVRLITRSSLVDFNGLCCHLWAAWTTRTACA